MRISFIKQKYSLIIGTFFLLVFSSCEDLNEDISGVFVTDSFYKSASDFDLGVNSIYSSMETQFVPFTFNSGFKVGNHSVFFAPHMGGDDIMSHFGSNKLPYREIDIFNASGTNITLFRNWNTYYETIYRANVLIHAASKSELPTEVINPFIAQARFLRAFTYFQIAKVWGDAPFPTDVNLDAVAEMAPSPVADIMNLVREDLEFAVDNIQKTSPSDKPSQANELSAKALLADVYMKLAGWPFKDESYYAKAASMALDVINSGKFVMFDDFANNFDIAFHNSSNKEIVFAFAQSLTAGAVYANALARTTFPEEESGWSDVMAQIGFFNAFPAGYRKDKTFHTTFLNGKNWTQGQLQHPFYAKYRSGSSLAKDGSGTDMLNNNRYIVWYRYPYILLTYAEAQAMGDGTPNAKAYDCINMVRRRAMKLPINTPNAGVDLAPGLGKIAFRDSVIAEKGWEFACEGKRWDDLVRTEKVVEMNLLHRDSKDTPAIQRDIANLPKEYYYYMPFQVDEMTRNTLLIQKDGYK